MFRKTTMGAKSRFPNNYKACLIIEGDLIVDEEGGSEYDGLFVSGDNLEGNPKIPVADANIGCGDEGGLLFRCSEGV